MLSIGHWQTAQAHGNQRCVYLLILTNFKSILTYRCHKANRREPKYLNMRWYTNLWQNILLKTWFKFFFLFTFNYLFLQKLKIHVLTVYFCSLMKCFSSDVFLLSQHLFWACNLEKLQQVNTPSSVKALHWDPNYARIAICKISSTEVLRGISLLKIFTSAKKNRASRAFKYIIV